MMESKLLARIGAAAFVGIAAVMTVLQLREEPPVKTIEPRSLVAPDADPLAARLRACARIGEAALSSTDCRAAWAEKRERFFGVGHPEAYSKLTSGPAFPEQEKQ